MHETWLHQPLLDDKFVYSRYLAFEEADVKRGSMRSVCSIIVYASTFVPNGTAYVIDARVDAVMFIHRDVTVEDWMIARAFSEYLTTWPLDSKKIFDHFWDVFVKQELRCV